VSPKPQALRFRWEQELRASDLSTKARHVGHLMATYANPDGTKIFPGVTLLAKGAGMGVRTVHKGLRELREGGWVQRVREGNSRNGLADEYRLTVWVRSEAGSPAQVEASRAPRVGLPAESSAEAAVSGARENAPPDQSPSQETRSVPDPSNTKSLTNEERLRAIWAEVERAAAEEERKKKEQADAEEARIAEAIKHAPSFWD
jgi:hypothetical protein